MQLKVAGVTERVSTHWTHVRSHITVHTTVHAQQFAAGESALALWTVVLSRVGGVRVTVTYEMTLIGKEKSTDGPLEAVFCRMHSGDVAQQALVLSKDTLTVSALVRPGAAPTG